MKVFFKKDWVKRALRTFVISFAVLIIPGSLGWLNDVTEWARAEGQAPFPDATSLAYLGVQAIVAGFIAVGNLLWNFVENLSGKALLRNIPPSEEINK